jgi:hypothetical protein
VQPGIVVLVLDGPSTARSTSLASAPSRARVWSVAGEHHLVEALDTVAGAHGHAEARLADIEHRARRRTSPMWLASLST